SQVLNIAEENLHCHHLLFIQDVTSSTYDPHKDCFHTKTINLSFRRAKLNGIIVAQESLLSNSCIWLGNVIRVILPKSILKRPYADQLQISNNVTLFGKIQLYNDTELVIECAGFNIEDSEASEMYHWLKVLQNRPKVTATVDKNMFYSLSSLPSPTRLLKENFMQSPIRDINSKNAGFQWSPDHAFATSTPIRSVHESPLRKITHRPLQIDDDDDDDEFVDFGSIDFGALENNALLEKSNNKRKFDFND
ncbi:hypothetical protein INT48_004191, partial [Thamnidium elegans]